MILVQMDQMLSLYQEHHFLYLNQVLWYHILIKDIKINDIIIVKEKNSNCPTGPKFLVHPVFIQILLIKYNNDNNKKQDGKTR